VSDIDDIRRQMAQIRRDMHVDVSQVVGEVEEAMDWRSVIRNHPYVALGVGLAVGYFIVPKRRGRVERAADRVRPLLEASTTPVYEAAAPEKPRKSLGRRAVGWALGLLWPLVSQSAQAYASMWLESQLKQHLNLNPHPAPPGDDSSSPKGGPGDPYGGDAVYRMPKRG
jgi:hypothetical protein